MNNYFEFDEEEFRKIILESFNYREDLLYNKDLDIKCNLKIRIKDLGKENTLKYKVNKEKRQIKISIPKKIENGQVIVVKGEGERREKQYGNLKIKVEIR